MLDHRKAVRILIQRELTNRLTIDETVVEWVIQRLSDPILSKMRILNMMLGNSRLQ